MSPHPHPKEYPIIAPDSAVKLSMGTVATILVSAFIVGSTFSTYAVKFSALSDKVDKLAAIVEKHVGSTSIASAARSATASD